MNRVSSKWVAIAFVASMLLSLMIIPSEVSGTMDPGWTKNKVLDSPGSQNGETSIAVDSNGHVHIAYSNNAIDGNYERLWYSTNASGSWVSTLIDYNPHTGLLNSIAVDSNGHAHIAYFDYINYCVKYATDASGSWVNETVDPSEDTGQLGISLAVDSLGNPHIAYQNRSTGDYILSYAEKVGGSWKIEQVDIDEHGEQTGVDCSIALDSQGYSHISYLKNQTLGYATNEGGSWVNTTLDYSWEAGWESSIAIDSLDNIHISYQILSFTPDHLMYLTDASGSWVNETVSTDSYGSTDIVVDSNDHPRILSMRSGALALFTKTDSSWEHTYPFDDSTYSPSMAIDSHDKLHVSYAYNADLYYATNSINIDTTAPTITITGPTSESTYSTTVSSITISGTCSDDVGVTSIDWMNAAGGSGSVSVNPSWSVVIALTSGSNAITLTAYDAAGHSTTDTITVTYTPDNVDPTVTITLPTTESTYTTDQVYLPAGGLAGTASDTVGVTEVTWENLDTGASGTASGTTNWETAVQINLNTGDNILRVTAHDAAGNTGIALLTVNLTTDITAPTVSISTPVSGTAINTTSIEVEWTGDDNIGLQGFQYRLDDEDWSILAIEYEHTFSDLSVGEHMVYVKAYDLENNNATDSASFVVDLTLPVVLSASPSNGTAIKIATISWTGQDQGSGIEHYRVRVDNGTWSDPLVSPSFTFIGLADGHHWGQIRAFDRAGNHADRFLSFILDTTPPQLSITTPSTGGTYSTNVSTTSVSGTISDLNGILEVKWTNSRGGSGTATLSDSGWSIGSIDLEEGSNLINVTAKDGANNTATVVLTVTYTPDSVDEPFPVWIIALVIVIIVAVIIAIYMFRRGKK